jgi:hypothetical protein
MKSGERQVVKLDLGEGQPSLNVFPVGQDGETLTLVCPFPLLSVDLPVHVTLPGQEPHGAVAGTIRRVAVEPMGEDGLPKFKLHVELRPPPAASPETSGKTLIATPIVASRTAETDSTASDETDADIPVFWNTRDVQENTNEIEEETLTAEETSPPPKQKPAAMSSWSGLVPSSDGAQATAGDQEPASASWSGATDLMKQVERKKSADDSLPWLEPHDRSEMVLPDPPAGRDPVWAEDLASLAPAPQPRRAQGSQWLVKTAAAVALVFSAVALGATMWRPIMGWLNPLLGEGTWTEWMEQAKSKGAIDEAEQAPPLPEPAGQPSTNPTPATVTLASAQESAGQGGQSDMADQAIHRSDLIPPNTEVPANTEEQPKVTTTATAAEDVETAGAPAQDAVAENELVEAEGAEGAPEFKPIRLHLPTQWPVTQARSYRLNDPLGLVIDVPGGMAAESARWVDTRNERVRSVRVLERPEGVRFIIYLTDDFIPRYQVGYGRSGVSVVIMGPDPRHET